jgi:hypothetical protein
MTTSQPPAAVSISRRSYLSLTRLDTDPQPGQAADTASVLATIRTVLPVRETPSTRMPVRCGSSAFSASRSHRAHAHRNHISPMRDTPDRITEKLCQSQYWPSPTLAGIVEPPLAGQFADHQAQHLACGYETPVT